MKIRSAFLGVVFLLFGVNALAQTPPSRPVVDPDKLSARIILTLRLESGWSLVGNPLSASVDVQKVFGSRDKPVVASQFVTALWAWSPQSNTWKFWSPKLTVRENEAWALGNGYNILTEILPSEGYWVQIPNNVSGEIMIGAGQIDPKFFLEGVDSLSGGWNIISLGIAKTPREFNLMSSGLPPQPGKATPELIQSLWAWDRARERWFFYSPLLENRGGAVALYNYTTQKGYLDFSVEGRLLDLGEGFWVNISRPPTNPTPTKG